MADDDPVDNHSPAFRRGEIFWHRGQLEAARRCFEEALAEERRRGQPERVMPVLLNVGSVQAALGNRDAARACFQEVLALQREAPDARVAGQALVNLGNLARESGARERARAYYLEALDLLTPLADARSLGVLHSNVGLLELDAGKLEDAIIALKTAIDFHKRSGFEEGLAGTWGQLGRAFLQIGTLDQAETCFNFSSSHFISLGDPTGEAEALRGLVAVYEAKRDPELVTRCRTRIAEIQARYGLAVRPE
ncbi:MAG: tetratricopeptide repeat protein [Nitrospirota bacterium]